MPDPIASTSTSSPIYPWSHDMNRPNSKGIAREMLITIFQRIQRENPKEVLRIQTFKLLFRRLYDFTGSKLEG